MRVTGADRIIIVLAGVLFAVGSYLAPNLLYVVAYLVVLLLVIALVLLNARRRKDCGTGVPPM